MSPIMALFAQTLQCLSISLGIKASYYDLKDHELAACPARLALLRLLRSLFSMQLFKHTSKLPAEGLHTGCSLYWYVAPDMRLWASPWVFIQILPSQQGLPGHAISKSSLTATYLPSYFVVASQQSSLSHVSYVTRLSCLSHLLHYNISSRRANILSFCSRLYSNAESREWSSVGA